jgi:hypothetical protein
MKETRVLRVLLVFLVLGILGAAGILHLVSLEYAESAPELAHLRLPIYLAVVAGFVPTLVAVTVVFALLRVVDHGEAFSARTVTLLRRVVMLFAITAVYLGVGIAGVSAAVDTGLEPAMLLIWLGAMLLTLILLTVALLLARLFSAALELRRENELTV